MQQHRPVSHALKASSLPVDTIAASPDVEHAWGLQSGSMAQEQEPSTSQVQQQADRPIGMFAATKAPRSSSVACTTPELRAARAAKAGAAIALTGSIQAATHWHQLAQLYADNLQQMNHIHMSALLVRLAHLTTSSSHPTSLPTHASTTQPASASTEALLATTAASRTKHSSHKDSAALHLFLSKLVPWVGMHLLTFGPRQLASSMWALARLGFRPEPAWVAEWCACMARKLESSKPKDLAMAAWGLVSCGTLQHATATGAPGLLLQLALAAVQPGVLQACSAQDVSNLAWALAASGLPFKPQLLVPLVQRALELAGTAQAPATQLLTADAAAASSAGNSASDSWRAQWQGPQAGAAAAAASLPRSKQVAGSGGSSRDRAHAQQGRAIRQSGFSPQELSALIWACGKLRCYHTDHVSALLTLFLSTAAAGAAAEARGHVSAAGGLAAVPATPQQYATVLWAMARLHHSPPADQMASMVQGLVGRAPAAALSHQEPASPQPQQLSGADMAQALWALGVLRYIPARPVLVQLLSSTYAALQGTAVRGGAEDEVCVILQEPDGSYSTRAGAGSSARSSSSRQQAHGSAASSSSTADGKHAGLDTDTDGHDASSSAGPPSARIRALPPGSRVLREVSMSDIWGAAGPQQQDTPSRAGGMGSSASGGGAELSAMELLSIVWGLRSLRVQLPVGMQCTLQAASKAVAPDFGALAPAGMADFAQCMAFLGTRPSHATLTALSAAAVHKMNGFSGRHLARLLMACVLLRFRPPRALLETAAGHVAVLLGQGDSPQPAFVVPAAPGRKAATAAAAGAQVPAVLKPAGSRDLVLLAWGLARLGSSYPDKAWSNAYLRLALSMVPTMSSGSLRRLVWAVRALHLKPGGAVRRAFVKGVVVEVDARAAAAGCAAPWGGAKHKAAQVRRAAASDGGRHSHRRRYRGRKGVAELSLQRRRQPANIDSPACKQPVYVKRMLHAWHLGMPGFAVPASGQLKLRHVASK
eukprot:CAMPEP_0202862204 /NCGR_PEP_ID=MMETSP1391-20130828/3331_1 /ASSEMBLY_ACC=CAM_ASM_000867 /TAXON_ID=1034604 /ORGANISM="Chlamydomonas leiostraca, Strain SAG 11-49" /LENGTH=991 /DNA_ID=CAMNT_0049541709 /DNA_START=181 /DNA_END=3156 /DNA_ORIENTATION=+